MSAYKTSLLILIGLAMSLATATAQIITQAYEPESGFYWNPDQPGRGFAIEVQDRQVFLTIYTYTEEANPALREPLWFSAIGNLTASTTGSVTYQFNDELVFSEDGQCLNCEFRDPISTFTGRPLSLTFNSLTTGQLVIDGEVIPIQRFWYSASIDDPFLAMQGQWAIVTDCTAPINNSCFPSDVNVQPFEADFLTLDFVTGSGTNSSTEGLRGATNIEVAGDYDPVDNLFIIVVAETTEEFLAYVIFGEDFGTTNFSGIAERYTPGGSIFGDGFPMFGRKVSDLTFTETLNPAAKSGTESRAPTGLSRSNANSLTLLNAARKLKPGESVPAAATKAQRLAGVGPMLRNLEAQIQAKNSSRSKTP
ncbi:MAG: hypothetical protein AB8B96_12945 [Lysobacterales bacterium]